MQEQLITFETAKVAKEKGFQYNTDNNLYYNSNGYLNILQFSEEDVPAPTQSLLQRWLREKYNQHIYLFPLDNGKWGFENNSISINLDHIFINYMYEGKEYNSYEEALEVGLQEALNFINSDLFIDNEG